MRSFHCTALVAALAVAVGAAAAPRAAQPRHQLPASGETAVTDFKVFVRGAQIGTEEVSVVRTPAGMVISGSGRLSAPLDVVTNKCEVRYDAAWRPVEANFDAIVHGQYTLLRTVFADGSATTQMVQAGQQATRSAKVAPDTIVLLNAFFGLYEALAARLATLEPGAELHAYILPVQEIGVQFKSVSEEKIQTPARTIVTRHYVLSMLNPGLPTQMDLWVDENQRLLHVSVPAQSFDMLRSDIATVSARLETVSRPGDEQVKIPANGFSLAGTVSKPTATSAKPGAAQPRYPVVVLVGGSGPTDRDEFVFDIPIFGHVAGALADAGFVVLRYDKRGVGQSGGRADSATLQDYADDARAAVKYLQSRRDVDPKRVAIAGYSEGGWAAMLAGARNKDVAAVVLIATPGVTGAELVLAQQEHVLQGMKLPPDEQQAKIDLQKKIQKAVLTGGDWEGIPDALRRQADTPWFHSFLAFDPSKVMPDLRQSVLILQGDLDRQIFAAQADRLAQMARARKAPANKEVTLVHLPGINHLLVPATTGEYDEYSKLTDRNVSKELLSAMVKWLAGTLKAR
jgi:pimeloyl-ACP methyl ester carboxylesterase